MCHDSGPDGRVSGPITSWGTRAAAPRPSEPGSDGAVSDTPSLNAPTRPDRHRRGSRGARPPAFDKQVGKRRNAVERCFNRLKQWRGIATRYDKIAQSYEAAVTPASLLMRA